MTEDVVSSIFIVTLIVTATALCMWQTIVHEIMKRKKEEQKETESRQTAVFKSLLK